MYTIELNNERRDASFLGATKVRDNSPVVEIFNAMVAGKDLAPYGAKADKAAKYIAELNNKASMGDFAAEAELNNIRRLAIQPILLEEIKLLGIFGNYTPLGYEESCEIEVTEFENINPKEQALGQDVGFPVVRKKRVSIATTTISGGYAVDYRKAALGDMSKENQLQEEVRKQIRNKASMYVVKTVYEAIKNATGVKYFLEESGLTKTNADAMIAKVRRWGKPTVYGDYALISQFNAWAGYVGTAPVINGISEKVMNEIQSTGLLGMYNGAVLAEMPNPYDLTKVDGGNFATMLPAGLGFVFPAGNQSPVHTVTRGGLTSLTGNDITTGQRISRFDLEVGAYVEPGKEYKMPIIHDLALDDLA